MGVSMHFILLVFSMFITINVAYAQNYIPKQAYDFRTIIELETEKYFPEIPNRSYIPALIEHESCITLRHSKCWNSKSQLKSSRELGVGLGQITKAYNPDGSVRFDSLYELRTKYKTDLKDASWETIHVRPDVQIRMIVLMNRDNYRRLYDVDNEYGRMGMMDAAYNGGMGGMLRERRQCSLTKGCNPNLWFGHIEHHCLKSKKVLYGNRSACDINRAHVFDTLKVRMPKYEKQYWN